MRSTSEAKDEDQVSTIDNKVREVFNDVSPQHFRELLIRPIALVDRWGLRTGECGFEVTVATDRRVRERDDKGRIYNTHGLVMRGRGLTLDEAFADLKEIKPES